MVFLTYKTQVLMKAEDQEGTDATPTGSNALLAIEPSTTWNRSSNERRVAAQSLSRERAIRGRQSIAPQFGLDLRGRGTLTKPELSLPWRACGMRELAVRQITVASTTGFSVGDVVRQSDGASPVNYARGIVCTVVSGTVLKVGWYSQAAFQNTAGAVGNLVNDPGGGAASSAVSGVSSVANEYVYIPDSRRGIYVPLSASLTGLGTPSGDYDGEGVKFTSGGTTIAAGTIRRYDYTSATKALYVDLAFGQPANTHTVTTSSGGSGTVSGTPTWSTGFVPAVTIYNNTDGYREKITGARGSFVMKGSVGESGRVDFSFTGKFSTLGDAVFATSASYASDAAPVRIMGTSFKINGLQLPTGSVELDIGNNVAMRPDAGDAVGDISAMIVEREPVIRVDPEWQSTLGVDFSSLWDAQTYVPIDFTFGSSSGNTIRLIAKNCEITNIGKGNRDGIWTGDLELRPRRVATEGDDEFLIHVS